MIFEIERKAHIDNPSDIIAILNKKAIYKQTLFKNDIYFSDVKDRTIDFKRDKIFRLREAISLKAQSFEEIEKVNLNNEKNKLIVTIKNRKIINHTEINEESEFNIDYDDKDKFIEFAKYLNYFEFITKEKQSIIYEYKNVNIEINKVKSLGFFIEIEILVNDENKRDIAILKLNEIFNEFNISQDKIENRLYIDLLLEKK